MGIKRKVVSYAPLLTLAGAFLYSATTLTSHGGDFLFPIGFMFTLTYTVFTLLLSLVIGTITQNASCLAAFPVIKKLPPGAIKTAGRTIETLLLFILLGAFFSNTLVTIGPLAPKGVPLGVMAFIFWVTLFPLLPPRLLPPSKRWNILGHMSLPAAGAVLAALIILFLSHSLPLTAATFVISGLGFTAISLQWFSKNLS